MEQLTAQDYRSVLDCVGELYSHHDLASFTERLLTAVQKVIGADYSTFTEINERFRRVGCISNPAGVIPKPTREQQARYFGEHPLWLHFTKSRFTSPARISDYFPRRRYRETAFYREIFRNLGVEAMMASSPISPHGGILPAVALIRSIGDFSERDRLKLSLLHPHIHRAYEQAEHVTVLRENYAMATEALAAARQAVIILAADGKMLFCTEPARQCLTSYYAASHRNSRLLPKPIRDWLRRQELPAPGNGNLPPLRQPFVAERGDGRLTIDLLSGQITGQRILLLEELSIVKSVERLQQRLELTRREAEVLFWVAQGKMNGAIAILLGLSVDTVEKHVENIFGKLNTENRTAAARCAHEVFSSKI